MHAPLQAQDPRLVEASLLIFAELADPLAESLRPFMGTLHSVLLACLGAQQQDVAVAAAHATTAFIQALEDASDRDKFQVRCSGAQGGLRATQPH